MPSAGAPFRWPNRSGADIIVSCDVTDLKSVDKVFAEIKKSWGGLDFVVHALAFSDRRELAGRYADTTRENFTNTMVISCFSFTEIAKRASEMMPTGGSLLTLTFSGATRWVPCYNVMGVAKAALEASVRYLAADLGAQGIRVNALSAGPMRTLAGAGVSDGRMLFNYQRDHAPAAALADARRGGRRRPLSAVGPVGRGDGRGALRRLRLQYHRRAEHRCPESHGAGPGNVRRLSAQGRGIVARHGRRRGGSTSIALETTIAGPVHRSPCFSSRLGI